MTDAIADESKALQAQEDVCPVLMSEERTVRCGRPLHHPAGDGGKDRRPVCLMHSVDRFKMSGPLYEEFSREIETILEAAGEGEAAFDEFVFPQMQWEGKRFLARCWFDSAVFWADPELNSAVFHRDVSFTGTRFEMGASFRQAEMKGKCSFMMASFTYQAHFRSAVFRGNADFSCVKFSHEARFEASEFQGKALFGMTRFAGAADFCGTRFGSQASFDGCQFNENLLCMTATFSGPANFERAVFSKEAVYHESKFGSEANWANASFKQASGFSAAKFLETALFTDAKFVEDASFTHAAFAKEVDFRGTIFSAGVNYTLAGFSGVVEWAGCKFLGGAQFRSTTFASRAANEPSAIFMRALFGKPKEVVFDDVDLSHVVFHDCDVSELRFSPTVRWAERAHRAGVMIFEEIAQSALPFPEAAHGGQATAYRSVAKIYQQLKKNYDGSLDYWTADQFHFGEMEMKRLSVDADGPLYGLRKWFLPRFGLVAWYRYASDYGNSYGKPLVWMVTLLVMFAALYALPGVGLARSGVSGAETYANVWQAKLTTAQNLGLEVELVGRGLLAAIDVAGFQKSPEYSPAYPWGRVLAIAETVLTSTLFGLFLLAIRRQFRR